MTWAGRRSTASLAEIEKRVLIKVHLISPHNETAAVQGLAAELRSLWPEVENSAVDRVDFLVGARAGVSTDLLIVFDLETPRAIEPGGPLLACGIIAVEVKQLCSQRFEAIGNQLVARYEELEKRTVVDQAREAALAIKNFGRAIGQPDLYVYAIAWLNQVDEFELQNMDEAIVGRQAGIAGIVRAALRAGDVITKNKPAARAKVQIVRDRFIVQRTLSPLDRKKADRIARNAVLETIVGDLAAVAGKKMVRVAGHGGSGKTTALTLLASRLADGFGARVLVLTFHAALCTDIQALLEAMPSARPYVGNSLCVMTASSFLLSLLGAIGEVPKKADGKTDYDRLDAAFRAVTVSLGAGLSENIFASPDMAEHEIFAWDHILIDEAQDWTDEERDFLRAIYGHKRLILMDGLAQLVRRQVSCDWLVRVPAAEREVRFLQSSLRMTHNVALFANAFADTLELGDWRVEPTPELSGGRVVIVTGPLEARLPLVFAMGEAVESAGARPVDMLLCVPPPEVQKNADGIRQSIVGCELESVGLQTWDACDGTMRGVPPASSDSWRIVQYDSCRGLEGYAVLLFALDDLYANKLKHPNQLHSDREVDARLVAERFLLIPMTRAVQLLVIHIRDVESPVYSLLREAASLMPAGVVEWCTASDAPARIAPLTPPPTAGSEGASDAA